MPDKNRELVAKLKETDPDSKEWDALAEELSKRFPKMYAEDQEEAASRLAEVKDKEGVAALIKVLAEKKGITLPALIALEKAMTDLGKDIDDFNLAKLEEWKNLCETDTVECQPSDYFMLEDREKEAVIEHLATWLKGDLLTMLKDSATNKEDAKKIGKALHRAKSMGASVSEQTGGAVYSLGEKEERFDEAYITPPDSTGTIFFYLFKTVFGQSTMFVMLANDQNGVIRFEAYRMAYHKFLKILESTEKNPYAMVAKADPNYVRSFIKAAEERGRKSGVQQHEDYLSNRRALGVADAEDMEHPVWKGLDKDKLSGEKGLVSRSVELLNHRAIEGWNMSPLEEGRVVQELTEMRKSPLELSDQQKVQREWELFEKEAKKSIEDTGRELWEERLLNVAYVLQLIKDEEPAEMAAATALSLEKGETPPLFVELMKRSVERDMAPDDEGPEGPDMDRGGVVVK